MRTNIDIDDKLMQKAMKASKLEVKTKKAVVEEALELYVQINAQATIRGLRGKVEFDPTYDHKALRGGESKTQPRSRARAA
ncbi:MAG: type II toxin-antitoxin system VapB family antitoxin [Acidobacteriaceae bacterium]|nr:type II toxin-antitoxin system VapB family antitoxin [Acidobacteriaceae bacterium]